MSVEQATADHFADVTEIQKAGAEPYVNPGTHAVVFRGAKEASTEVIETKNDLLSGYPGARLVTAIAKVVGTDVAIRNVKFLTRDVSEAVAGPDYEKACKDTAVKGFKMWANYLTATGQTVKNEEQFAAVIEHMREVGCRWDIGLLGKREGEDAVFVRSTDQIQGLIDEGYEMQNFLYKKPGSAKPLAD